MEIAIDFDGTVVTHSYPEVGEDIGAIPVLKKIVDTDNKLILNTMRSGSELTDAINWFKQNNIPLYGINQNPKQKSWTTSTKTYAQLYIDDAALGCPLTFDGSISIRPFVDWVEVEKYLKYHSII